MFYCPTVEGWLQKLLPL